MGSSFNKRSRTRELEMSRMRQSWESRHGGTWGLEILRRFGLLNQSDEKSESLTTTKPQVRASHTTPKSYKGSPISTPNTTRRTILRFGSLAQADQDERWRKALVSPSKSSRISP